VIASWANSCDSRSVTIVLAPQAAIASRSLSRFLAQGPPIAVAATGSGDAFAVRLDLADPASIGSGVAAAEAQLGRLDGLVNCAAIVVHADPLETTWADWEKIFRVNLFGAYEVSRASSPSR
jgi:NAD(P)-dependent dehydrogenase (short-subunit alcohol dehydrogenase family)